MDKASDPSTPSLAHDALKDQWAKIRTILAGPDKVKDAGVKYLPQFPSELDEEYGRRKAAAPWRPEFEDILRSVVGKPFSKTVKLIGQPSSAMQAVAEDVDGRGNSLHVFAKDAFEGGVSLGLQGILVDFPTMNPGATLAEERAAGARPYWVAINADEILALRTERHGAREVVTHLRLREEEVVTEGFAEKKVEKIRVIEPTGWQVYTEVETGGLKKWALESEGPLTLGEVPFVIFATADRKGPQYVRPPLLSLADMQMELYRFQSGEEQIYTMAGAPMLTANGMAAPDDGAGVEVGPGRVLYAPAAEGSNTSWAYIQPDAANLAAITAKAQAIIEDMRRLGMQPLLPRTGQVTATASGVEAAKAHSAVQSWALDLKDALEQAFAFTAAWMKSSETVEVHVNTDFAVGIYGAEEVRALLEAREKNIISERTFWDEMTRRGVLGPQFDADEEEQRLINELPGEADIAAATTPPVMPPPPAGQPPNS